MRMAGCGFMHIHDSCDDAALHSLPCAEATEMLSELLCTQSTQYLQSKACENVVHVPYRLQQA